MKEKIEKAEPVAILTNIENTVVHEPVNIEHTTSIATELVASTDSTAEFEEVVVEKMDAEEGEMPSSSAMVTGAALLGLLFMMIS